MNRKTIFIIQIVLAAVVLLYIIMPDLFVGPFDDVALLFLIGCAEVFLGIVQARQKNADSGSNSGNNSSQYDKKSTYSNNYKSYNDYQNQSSDYDSDNQDSEFQFFAGCNNWEQVKSRYRDLMKIYHPDAGGNEEASKKINAEYNALKAKYGK